MSRERIRTGNTLAYDGNAFQRFRDQTNEDRCYVNRGHRCPSCKRNRSEGQFEPGKENCKTCRGVR